MLTFNWLHIILYLNIYFFKIKTKYNTNNTTTNNNLATMWNVFVKQYLNVSLFAVVVVIISNSYL